MAIQNIGFPTESYSKHRKLKPQIFSKEAVILIAMNNFCTKFLLENWKPEHKDKNIFSKIYKYKLSNFEIFYVSNLNMGERAQLFQSKKLNVKLNCDLIQGILIIDFRPSSSFEILVNISIEYNFLQDNINIEEFYSYLWNQVLIADKLPFSQNQIRRQFQIVPKKIVFYPLSELQELKRIICTDLMGNEAFDDLSVDIINEIYYLWTIKSTKELYISIDDLIYLRGKKQNMNGNEERGGYKLKVRNQMAQRLKALNQIIYKYKSTKIRLFYIRELKPFYYQINLGDMFRIKDCEQTTISQKVIQYDSYKNRWEKRLGNFLTYYFFKRRKTKNIKVQTLMQQIMKDLKNLAPNKIRNRFEAAMDKLCDDKIIKSWHYTFIDEDDLMVKKWLEIWLNYEVKVAIY